jgi:hypothetical protein
MAFYSLFFFSPSFFFFTYFPDNEPTAGMRGFSSFIGQRALIAPLLVPPNATLGVVKLWLYCGCLGPIWLRLHFLDYLSACIARDGAG